MSEIVLSLFRGEIVKPDSITMKSIAEAVAYRHDLTLADLKGPARCQRVAHARHEAMWLMRQVRTTDGRQRYSSPMIGRFFNRDHSTVLSAELAHEARLAEAQGREAA